MAILAATLTKLADQLEYDPLYPLPIPGGLIAVAALARGFWRTYQPLRARRDLVVLLALFQHTLAKIDARELGIEQLRASRSVPPGCSWCCFQWASIARWYAEANSLGDTGGFSAARRRWSSSRQSLWQATPGRLPSTSVTCPCFARVERFRWRVFLVRQFPGSLSNSARGLRGPSVAPLGHCPLTLTLGCVL